MAISILVGILFGLAPALKSWSDDPQKALKEGGRGSSRGLHHIQSGLIVGQMALTLVLLVGAGLLLRTVLRLWDVNPGFDAKHLITFRVGVSHSLTKTASSTRIAYRQLIERIRQIPGLCKAADFSDTVPLSGQGGTLPFWLDSHKPDSLQGAPRLQAFLTGPDYRHTLGIPLLRGRFLTSGDTTKSPCVAVIDSVFSQTYFPRGDAMDHTITAGFAPFGPCQIVGVVGHVKNWGLNDSGIGNQSQAYYSLYQDTDQWVPLNFADTTMIVRTPLEPGAVMPAIKSAVYEAGNDQPVYRVLTMQQIISESMSAQRFPMILLAAFAGLALLLAAVGIYGVISYFVTQRIHEIGIRIALGANKRNILGLVIGQGLRLALAGVVAGGVGALILMRILSSLSHLLYGVGANDPITFFAVALALLGVAFLACYIPARRAAQVDPLVALGYE